MGRVLDAGTALGGGAASAATMLVSGDSSIFKTTSPVRAALGVFGSGWEKRYDQPGTFMFTVPDGVSSLRVSVVGGGGGGGGDNGGQTGGTSSFGAHCSATGGRGGAAAAVSVPHTRATGGSGTGGDMNFSGGDGGLCGREGGGGGGGGGVATPFGDGGDGGDSPTTNAGLAVPAPGHYSTGGGHGQTGHYSNGFNGPNAAMIPIIINPLYFTDFRAARPNVRQGPALDGPFIFIGGDGSGGDSSYEGSGGGGGGWLQGGRAGQGTDAPSYVGGAGGAGGGGGGGAKGGSGGAGGGLTIKTVAVSPGSQIIVTVGAGGAGGTGSAIGGKGGDGLVIVEW